MKHLVKHSTLLAVIFLWFILPAGLAQEPVVVERSNNKVVIEGKVYYVHVVKAGQTLYSIGRAYNVGVKEIMIENPGTNVKDIRIGQVLKIPSNPTSTFQVDTRKMPSDTNVHIISEGETIYSISRKYNCTVESIIEENPGIDINDLRVGQPINIPLETPVNEYAFDEEGIIFHKVKRRETLYSISRYYGVSISEIRNMNPELGWGGPRAGDILKIPKPNTTGDVVFVKQPDETDTVPVEVDTTLEDAYEYDWLAEEEYDPDRMYRIAYLIPFDYEEPEPLDSLLRDVRSPAIRKRITEQYELDLSRPESVNFLEFLEGSLMAIDSLTDAGMKLEVQVFDTKKSMFHTRQLLERPGMNELDLVIGPFYAYNLELVSDFCRQNRIPMVNPFYGGDSLVKNNPYFFQATPTYQTEYRKNAEYLARHYDKNLVFVHDGDSSKAERIDYYKLVLFDELRNYSALETVLFKEVIIKNGDTEDLVHALNSDQTNIVILPVTDEAFASQVASRLFYMLGEYDIHLFGSPYWVGFDNIQINYIHSLKLVISNTHWYDFNDREYLEMLKKFRDRFFREPAAFTRKGCNYAFTGYDLTFYFLSALQQYGPMFLLDIEDYRQPGTLCDLRFVRVDPFGGYENRALHFYQFDPDLTVKKIDIPEQPPVHYYLQPAQERLPLFFRNRQPEGETDDDPSPEIIPR